MTGNSDGGETPRWQDAATIGALLTCYDVWSATPHRDCTVDLLRRLGVEPAR